ncbi:hypothetical protein [Thioalkalivibrio sp. XN8]|uniref:hypothetical protein n=1 Tax=Thioalkalivibrio sp. XN8 TaxID=2712863 RepID=UPI0013ECC902|nr:hypothetical protein [Thioalkalivibrio sp. XN8]NGP54037.1 hypothetical protein [Thioalkalivibrio sp. XN8]
MRFNQTGEVMSYIEEFHEGLADAYAELAGRTAKGRSRMMLEYMSEREKELAESVRSFSHRAEDPALKEWDPFTINDTGIHARIKEALHEKADPDELLGLGLEVLAWLEGLYLRLEAKSGTPEQKELFASLRARAEREKHKLARNSNMLMDF